MYGMLYFSCCVLSMSASFLFLVAYCVWLFYNVFIFFAGLLSCLCNICQLIYFFQRDVPAGDASVRSPLISSHLNRSHLIRTELISSYPSTPTPHYTTTPSCLSLSFPSILTFNSYLVKRDQYVEEVMEMGNVW